MNKKGAALMQVLLVAVILAGIASMLLRASLSNTVSARKSRRNVSAQMLIESCMAEVNMMWSLKNDDAFRNDFWAETPRMYCDKKLASNGNCSDSSLKTYYDCTIPVEGYNFKVRATIEKGGSDEPTKMTYEIIEGGDYL